MYCSHSATNVSFFFFFWSYKCEFTASLLASLLAPSNLSNRWNKVSEFQFLALTLWPLNNYVHVNEILPFLSIFIPRSTDPLCGDQHSPSEHDKCDDDEQHGRAYHRSNSRSSEACSFSRILAVAVSKIEKCSIVPQQRACEPQKERKPSNPTPKAW